MSRDPVTPEHLRAVFAVPPLPRRKDARRSLDLDEAERLAAHVVRGGITRLLYGGNAFLYHVTLTEYETLLEWLAGFPKERWAIPSLGPSFGRAIDQARLLRRHSFRAAMMLPCSDPRDAAGLETGLREVAEAGGLPLIVYLRSEDGFGADRERGLDAIGRLVGDGVCVAVKYAVVRPDPGQDSYLEGLLRRVDRGRVVSGIGERPAVVHRRVFGLAGFTTGSGCLAPRLSSALFAAMAAGDWARAEELRAAFLPLEDLRDAWGPARVLHHATELAGVARTGPIPPFVSGLGADELARLLPVARALREKDA
ncbi:MAG TPA: dihydrodipicolinate synthase family protein [Vicinamibacteria bacterium]|nr:dihydrodipicolinate synthase family protein [Vicinamibacteria bacterium]